MERVVPQMGAVHRSVDETGLLSPKTHRFFTKFDPVGEAMMRIVLKNDAIYTSQRDASMVRDTIPPQKETTMNETSPCPSWCVRDHADGPSHESDSVWVPVDSVDGATRGQEDYLVVMTMPADSDEASVFVGDPDLSSGQHLKFTTVSARRIAQGILSVLDDAN